MATQSATSSQPNTRNKTQFKGPPTKCQAQMHTAVQSPLALKTTRHYRKCNTAQQAEPRFDSRKELPCSVE